MTANAALDGRIDWFGTYAALVAAFPNPPFPNGTLANTTDQGLQYWNKAAVSWLSVIQANNFGFKSNPLYRWRPANQKGALTFTGALAIGVTSATLSSNWGGATFLYIVTLSSGQQVLAFLTNGATNCTFYPYPSPASGGTYGPAFALTAAATANATVIGQGPVVGSANGYSVSASIGAAGSAVLTGALCAAGVGTPDIPRNVVGAWTTSSTVTVTGTDYYGNPQTETQTGTAFTGKKAFSSVTGITSSASITGATFGTGNVLGLPFRASSGDIFAVMFNDAADAGTFVAADLTLPATASTGDVRGTYAPAGTLNGVKFLAALIKVADNTTQVGSLGVTSV